VLKKLTVSLIVVLSFILWSCSDNNPNWPGPDTQPPAGITNLKAGDSTTTSLKLTWTAPGDNGDVGQAAAYRIDYYKDSVADPNWEAAKLVSNTPTPGPAGTPESVLVTGLDQNSKYFFNVVAVDKVGNVGPFSNIAEGFTAYDSIPPGTIADLTILDSAISFVFLSWTAPGDDGMDGMISQYRIRYDTTTITDSSWESATKYIGSVKISAAGTTDSLTITGLNSGTTYYFAVRATDEVNNMSDVSNVASATTLPLTPVNDLTVLDPLSKTTSDVPLTWTSPGTDGIYSTATAYDLRYMEGEITDTAMFDWAGATQCTTGIPTPNTSGYPDTFNVSGLLYNTVYTFALKTTDDNGNYSAFSNLYIDSTLWSRFSEPNKLKVGTDPVALVAADLNNSGFIDLAVANQTSNNVSILRNNGYIDSLSFAAAVNYKARQQPNSIVAAHLNSDNYLDLAVSNYYKDTVGTSLVYVVSVMTNRANINAQFNAPGVRYATNSVVPPSSIISADFGGSTLADLAVSNYDRDSVRILINNGNATFPDGYKSGYLVGDRPYNICAADFDGDGHSDIATANLYSNDVSILLYNADSVRFDSAVSYSVGTYPYDLTVADFNKDGNLDIAVSNMISDNVSILFGDGSGQFQTAINYSAGVAPNSIKHGDFDNDTWMDLAVTNPNSNVITVLLNDGTGAFPSDNVISYPAGKTPQDIAVGDFNQDGYYDIATTNPASDSVVVLINRTE
jgi:chitodextrinase